MSERKHVQFAESMRRMQDRLAPDQVNMAAALKEKPDRLDDVDVRTPNVMDEQFPTDQLTQKSERDRVMEAKLALQSDKMGYTPFGKLEARDGDFKWALEKQAAADRADLEAWFAKNFDLMSPVQKAHARKLFKNFYTAREKLLRRQCDNLFDFARIKLDGIQSLEDAKKMYMVETGRLDLGPLEHLLKPEGVNKGDILNADAGFKRNQQRFQRGLANPFLVFGKMAEPMTYDTRKEQSAIFAKRGDIGDNAAFGIRDTGFPPFSGDQSDQGTKDWFQNLTQGMSNLNV